MIINQNDLVTIFFLIYLTLISLTILILLLDGAISITGSTKRLSITIKKESPPVSESITSDCIPGEEDSRYL